MFPANKIFIYPLGLAATFLFLLLIKVFNVSYPLNLMITTTAKSTELSVVGEGKVDAIPDTVYVDLGISVNNATSAEVAREKIDEVNNKIIDSLKSLGIDAKDIKTGNYNITPAYSYSPGTENKITGYNGNASVTVKLKDTKLAASVITQATAAGANQIQGSRFVVDEPQKYREEARNKAIENAKEQAAKLSRELGITLGKIVNIVESTGGRDAYPLYEKSFGLPAAGGGGPQLEPGSQTVTSTVTLFFEKK